jgi:hypothetical protein
MDIIVYSDGDGSIFGHAVAQNPNHTAAIPILGTQSRKGQTEGLPGFVQTMDTCAVMETRSLRSGLGRSKRPL